MIDFGENFLEHSNASSGKRAPFILCCPHSGKIYPEEFLNLTILDKKEIRFSEDAFVDEIITQEAYDNEFFYLKMNVPRAFVDVNRAFDELDSSMFRDIAVSSDNLSSRTQAGFGVIPKFVKQDLPIYGKKLSFASEKYRILKYYKAYHDELKSFINLCKQQYNQAYILDFHSMPSSEDVAADIVLGDNHSKSCSKDFIDTIEGFLTEQGYKVWRNYPYSGGFTTYNYGDPKNNIHAIQIEICRALYMKEGSIRRDNSEIKELKLLFEKLLDILNLKYGI